MRRRVPMPTSSLKVICLPSGASLHPAVSLYSMLRQSCPNFGEPFRPGNLHLAVVVEPAHGRPGTFSTRLACLLTSPTGKSRRLGQHGRVPAHGLDVFSRLA